MHHSHLVAVKRVKGKGRGVFARRDIPEGTVIERVPVVLIPIAEFKAAAKGSVVARYVFLRSRTHVAFALGFGSLYNHSFKPNARYDDASDASMTFTALRDIAVGEEITVNYNGNPANQDPVDFDVV